MVSDPLWSRIDAMRLRNGDVAVCVAMLARTPDLFPDRWDERAAMEIAVTVSLIERGMVDVVMGDV